MGVPEVFFYILLIDNHSEYHYCNAVIALPVMRSELPIASEEILSLNYNR